MRPLRRRLGALIALITTAVTLLAVVAIAYERWQEQNNSLPTDVEFEVFQRAEAEDPLDADLARRGANRFVVVFDANAAVIGADGELYNQSIDALVDDFWSRTTEADLLVSFSYSSSAGTQWVAGVQCVDESVCDTVVVGATATTLWSYLGPRAGWLIGPPAIVGLIALLASMWLVGRSLRPVEAMRAEVAEITSTDLDRRVPVPVTGDELEALGSTLNATLDRLEGAVSANERFVADAAHELRSPLTGVRTALEVESARGGSGLVDDAIGEVDRAARLIDDLLVLARRGGSAPVEVDVDFDDIVRREVSAAAAAHPDVQVAHEIAPVRLRGDPDALRRVIGNLVENACRYCDRSVGVALQGAATRCRVVVDDDGPGIPEDQRVRVFERFARLDEARARATGGSGLGLAIVAEIVSDHRGTVEITDSPLGGTRVLVELPV